MPAIVAALVAGLAFGAFSVATMLPMVLDDKPRALAASFASRFSIGFLIPLVTVPWPGVLVGAVVGLLVSLSDAIVTRAFAPILLTGTLGGALIGWLTL